MHPLFQRVLRACRPVRLRGHMLDGTLHLAMARAIKKPSPGVITLPALPGNAALLVNSGAQAIVAMTAK